MTTNGAGPATADAAGSSADRAVSEETRRLLACGAAAGLLFLIVSFAQVFTRTGFTLDIHPLSALALGTKGWIQIANFLLTGVLAVAFAIGLRRALWSERAGTWAPVLIALYGVGLMCAGVFRTDPGYGFPAGAPAGMPEDFSAHAILHTLAAMVAFTSLTAATFVVGRRFAGQKAWALAVYSILVGVVSLALTALPLGSESASERFAIAAILTSTWLVALSALMRKQFAVEGP